MRRRALGQHYLVDRQVVDKMVALAGISGTDTVLEIGTGRGALTQELSRLCSRLVGYEVDPENLQETRESLTTANVKLHLADAFEEKPRFDVLVSSIPYSRSADFVEWLSQMRYRRAVVLLQEDFARKITAPAGERNYRAISAIAQISSEITLGERVKRASFEPQPKVSSVIAVFTPKVLLLEEQVSMIKRIFVVRRKTLGAALAAVGLESAGETIAMGERVYRLPPETVYALIIRLTTR